MAAGDFVNGGVHPFRHEALQLGLHGAVARGQNVPARFGLPGGAGNIFCEQVRGGCEVSRPHDLLLLLR